MHNQEKTNNKNQLAEFSLLKFSYLINGVTRTLKLFFFTLLFPCLWRYMPCVPRISKTSLKEMFANQQDRIIDSVKVRLKRK